MLKYIEEFKKYVAITGFRNVKIGNADNFLKTVKKKKAVNVDVQFFDAKFVATWQHLYFAVLNALKTFKNRENISKSLGMEIMLYASAQRQISRALEMMGVKDGTKNMAVVVVGDDSKDVESALTMISEQIDGEQDDKVLELWNGKTDIVQKTFQISEIEIDTVMKKGDFEKALVDLVIERVALLATER